MTQKPFGESRTALCWASSPNLAQRCETKSLDRYLSLDSRRPHVMAAVLKGPARSRQSAPNRLQLMLWSQPTARPTGMNGRRRWAMMAMSLSLLRVLIHFIDGACAGRGEAKLTRRLIPTSTVRANEG